MRNVIALLAIISLSGCGAGRIKVELDGNVTCSGGYVVFGDVIGPCGVTGGAISPPGAELAGEVIGQALTFVPGVSSPNPDTPDIVIKHQDSKSEPGVTGD